MSLVAAAIAADSLIPCADVQGILSDYEVWVYEGLSGAIIGLACRKEYSRDYGLRLFVRPGYRRQGIGTALYDFVRPSLDGPGPDRVTATYRVDAGHTRPFFTKRGFEPWYQMMHLAYRGPDQSTPAVDIRPYADEWFEASSAILGVSFYELRRSHGFEPNDVREFHRGPAARAEFAAPGSAFLAFDRGGRPVGFASIEGDFIDTVGVLPERRGSGYGRALTQYCLNVIRSRGYATVRTSVLADNDPAKRLYLSMGFEPVATYEDATMRLR